MNYLLAMENNNKSKNKLFNIFEKVKMGRKLKDSSQSSTAKAPKRNNLPARRSARLKSEIFVDCVPPESSDKCVHDIPKERIEEYKLIYNPQKKKPNSQKSFISTEIIDKYLCKKSVKRSEERCTTSSSCTITKAEEKTKLSKSSKSDELAAVSGNVLHLTDSFIIDSIDMLSSTISGNTNSELQNKNSNYITGDYYGSTSNQQDMNFYTEKKKISSRTNNDLSQINTCTDIPKNKQHDSKYTNLDLLKRKGNKTRMSTPQTMTNNSAVSICDNIINLKNEKYLLENLQKTIEDVTSKPLRTSSRKRCSSAPTVCKINLDNDLAKKSGNVENSEPVIKRMKRFTICNINQNTQVMNVTPKDLKFPIENKNIDSMINNKFTNHDQKSFLKLRKPKKQGEDLDCASSNPSQETEKTEKDAKSNCIKPGLRESARIRERRLTISNITLTSDDIKATKSTDYRGSPEKIIIAIETPDKSNANNRKGTLEIHSNTKIQKRATKDLNDKNKVSTKKASTSSMAVVNTNNGTSTELQVERVKASLNKVLEAKESTQEPKRKRGRPRSVFKSPKPIVKTQNKNKIRKINIANESNNTDGKLSKENLSSVNIRRIPQNRLDEVLSMLGNEDHPFWNDRNISCNAGIHHYWETRTMISDQNVKMKYARQFLLRRDWLSLSKILCFSSQDAKINNYYPLLVKYATLCLAHTDKEQFHKFIKSLINMDDSSTIIKKCTQISRKNERKTA